MSPQKITPSTCTECNQKPQFKPSDTPTVFRAMLVHENDTCSHNTIIRDYSATEAAEKWERINQTKKE